jgi:hypothetical protein
VLQFDTQSCRDTVCKWSDHRAVMAAKSINGVPNEVLQSIMALIRNSGRLANFVPCRSYYLVQLLLLNRQYQSRKCDHLLPSYLRQIHYRYRPRSRTALPLLPFIHSVRKIAVSPFKLLPELSPPDIQLMIFHCGVRSGGSCRAPFPAPRSRVPLEPLIPCL